MWAVTIKGVFAISSLTWKNPLWLTRVGLWTNTAPHDSLDGTNTGRVNSGVYWLGGWRLAAHGTNLRLGLSNAEVSRAARFAGLSYQYRHAPWVLEPHVFFYPLMNLTRRWKTRLNLKPMCVTG